MVKKIAIIDIGTYSTRLLISAIHKKNSIIETINSVEDIFSTGKITSLGRKLKETGYLQKDAIDETLSVLKEYKMIIDEYKVDYVKAYATQACREAKNGKDFVEKVKAIGIDVEIIDGKKEAYLSFLATAYGVYPDNSFVMIDQGGGSTEYAYGIKEGDSFKLKDSISFPFGIVGLTERFIKHDPPLKEELKALEDFIRKDIEKAYEKMKDTYYLIGLGGTITTLVALEKKIFPYSSEKVHKQRLSYTQINKWLNKLSSIPVEERKKIPQIEDKRAEVILSGILIFKVSMKVFNKEEIIVSDWGLRHGAIIDFILNKNL
ncbi:Ppx/GppA phosphatase family protein [Hydrogenothermus marinus]|uniref:Exopolyphosphatase/guanosine-5'-triphosphate, 3'-diphosphate pyrophosphatase n=1 Tax=Hydrogenothermus marinus TaxID=133270 RepID=A0A3M0B4Z4_9AQUI|nr:Ppx/GppA phosphatase family protein [Hydrogenothermus marinus]RMA92470.1 exopolyphosphatase/guanosine-5'-triphosphate,3'-diphosphate pyrophosphatase [Hydrogenothermus marinus]